MKRMIAMLVAALFLGATSTTALVGCKGGDTKPKDTKTEPAKTDPAKTEPAKTEPAK